VIDYENLKLLHSHGDKWLPMTRTQPDDHHGPAEHDPERAFGGWIYRCITCDELIAVEAPPEAGSRRP
jgi:hypothetical protein